MFEFVIMTHRRTVLDSFSSAGILLCLCLIISLALTRAFDNRTLTLDSFEHEIFDNDAAIDIDTLHSKGVEAYLSNDWDGCIKYFSVAAQEHRTFKKGTAKCRTRCSSENSDKPHMLPTNIENLHFYETTIRTTLCLLKCKKSTFKNKYVSITSELDKLYGRMKPYEYLHLCYYQKNMLPQAASACFTALIANPENDVMVSNFKFYSSLPEVNSHKIENMETKDFIPFYIKGVEVYNAGDYASAIRFLEKSLKKWISAADECRAYCEGPFDQGWLPEFLSSVANHFTYCLRCKQKCETSLISLNGELHDDMLPSHYNYLQFSYYKVDNLQKAAEAAKSYLLFYPTDETMLKNEELYSSYFDGNADIIPRKEALKYTQRQQYENKLLEFIDTEFKKLDESQKKDEVNEIIT